jgi:hypothetical protein
MGLFNYVVIIVLPRSSASLIKGRWSNEVGGTATNIVSSWQPASQRDIQSLPEGRRNNSVFKFYSNVQLESSLSGKNPDHVQVAGITYEIIAHAPWQNGLISHHKYLVTEVA